MPTPTTARRRVLDRLPSLRAPSRVTIVVLLAAVQSLDSADRSTLSAAEVQLQAQLHIGSAGFGLLATASSLVGIVAALPIGMLVDRLDRTRLLAVCTGVWALAEVGSAVSGSYVMLLVARLFLGAVLAAAPAVMSLVGDWFAVGRRARMFGYILSGELLGTALGYLVVGPLGRDLGWRWAFGLLAVLAALLAAALARLAEPHRGEQLRRESGYGSAGEEGSPDPESDDLEEEVARAGVPAPRPLVLSRDPAAMSAGAVLRYVLSVRSNVVLIVASAFGYLFLSGVQTFAFSFATEHEQLTGFGLSAALVAVGLGAVVGVLVTGRVADRLIRRGVLRGRPLVAAVSLGAAAVCFVPGVLIGVVWVSVPLLVLGAVALGGSNPPLDSARLDVVHHNAWGRTEGLRSTLRLVGYAVAPSLVGVLSAAFGIAVAFALLTGALLLAAGVLVVGMHWYVPDVSAAMATEERIQDHQQHA